MVSYFFDDNFYLEQSIISIWDRFCVAGFPGKAYCPRMALMNRPVFRAIQNHSPHKPVLVFVSSRRQTRLTAQDLVGFLATTHDPHQWLHMPVDDLEDLLGTCLE